MIRVYVAGPIGANDDARAGKITAALDAGVELLRLGFAPFVPHLWAAASINADGIAAYEHWMQYDFIWLRQCEILLRIPGASPGADREVEHAEAIGIPVFHSIEHLTVYRDILSRARERHGSGE